MLNLRAAGEGRSAHSVFVGVHECPQTDLLGFIARGIQLFLRKRHTTALANALGREDFDEVRACLLLFANKCANFIRRAAPLALSDKRLIRR